MSEEHTDIRGANIAMEETSDSQDTPFDRLEARIDALIQRYEQLQSEHNRCGEELAAKEVRIRELEAKLEHSEHQTSEVRSRLDALIDKLSRFS
ncbi:MAG: cell division protein ZapB [Syntrophobacterales bacterium]